MRLERQTDATLANKIVNDPSIYPWVRGSADGPLELSSVIANHDNHALFCNDGGVIFVRHMPGFYEAHTQVLPRARGSGTLAIGRAALHHMFTRTDAVEIITRVPEGNIAALAGAKRIGGTFEFRTELGWIQDGKVIPADIFAIRIQDWMRTAPGLEERGHWFHEKLEDDLRALGREQFIHDDDAVHDRYVGAAIEMISGGQPHKGVVYFNRFAVAANHTPVELVTLNPLVIDIKSALICVRENDFWVMG